MLIHELGTEGPLRRIVGGRPAVVEIPYQPGVLAVNLTSGDYPEQSYIIPTVYQETQDEQVRTIDIDPAKLSIGRLIAHLSDHNIALARGLDQEEYIARHSEFKPLENELMRIYHNQGRMFTQGLIFEDTTVVLAPNTLFYVHQSDQDTKVYISKEEGIKEVK